MLLQPLQCNVPDGGLVPKSQYMSDDVERDKSPEDRVFGEDTLYHTAYVAKDYPHEVSETCEMNM